MLELKNSIEMNRSELDSSEENKITVSLGQGERKCAKDLDKILRNEPIWLWDWKLRR